MIIYFYLFILLLFISADSSSIRSRSLKNELVPLISSRSDPLKKDSNSLKIVSNEPFIIQLQVPNSVERETKRTHEKEKKTKRPDKKRVSKIKALRKRHRRRRDLLTSKTKTRQEKSNDWETPNAANATRQLKDLTKNSINRMEILKALSSYSKIIENKRSRLEAIKNGDKKNAEKSPNAHKHYSLFSDRTPYVGLVYPSTPKFDETQHKYTYKDLIADRERLEQKIKYIKNMLNVNLTAADDSIRVRRRSESDKTANKIAKMFLTLSAVNGLHDKRKSKCDNDDEEEIWDRERRNNLSKKTVSSNEERYKVKKWIEFIKNKRSSSKTCPCLAKTNGEEADIFPLEQKLSKDYYHKERERSSEESSESNGDPFYYSRDKLDNNSKKTFLKSPDHESKLKALTRNGKKNLGLPLNDLEIYRSRAKQILQNAEEILDRIKEEEERRLSTPNAFVNQLRELTSKIQGDPRNKENDLIQKIQKNLGWGPLAKAKEGAEGNNFMDNVKSFILDPYEKAKALTDESTKKLSSYLLRNLGELQKSSEEKEEGREIDDKSPSENFQIYFEQIPQKEGKPAPANLAKEPEGERTLVFPNGKQDTVQLPVISESDEGSDKKENSGGNREKPYRERVENIIKEQQKKLNDYKVMHASEESSREIDKFDETGLKGEKQIEQQQLEKEAVKENNPEKNLGQKVGVQLRDNEMNENDQKNQTPEIFDSTKIDESEKANNDAKETGIAVETSNSNDFVKKKNFDEVETSQEKTDETHVTTAGDMQEEKEFETEIEKILKTTEENKEDSKIRFSLKEKNKSDETEKEPDPLKQGNSKYESMLAQDLEETKLGQERSRERSSEESEKSGASPKDQENGLKENDRDLQETNRKEGEENVLLSPHDFFDDEKVEKITENLKAALEGSSNEENTNSDTLSEKQDTYEIKTDEKDTTNLDGDENNFKKNNEELSNNSQNTKDTVGLKDSSGLDQVEALKDSLQPSPSNEGSTDMDNGVENPSAEQTDTVQETNHETKDFSEESLEKSSESTLKSKEQSNEENLTLNSPENGEDDITKEKTEIVSKEVSNTEDDQDKLQEILDERESMTPLSEQDGANINKKTENSNESLEESVKPEEEENSGRGNENDDRLKAENPENEQNESLENRSQAENVEMIIQQSTPRLTEDMSNESLDKNKAGEVNTEAAPEERNLEDVGDEVSNEESDETPLKEVQNSQIDAEASIETGEKINERKETASNSNEEVSNETFLKARLNEDQDSDKESYSETNSNKNANESEGGETENSMEQIGDKTMPKEEQDEETYNEKALLKTIKMVDDEGDQERTQKSESLNKKDSSETTLDIISDKKDLKSLEEVGDETSGEGFEDFKENLKKVDQVTSVNANPRSEGSDDNRTQEIPLRNNEEENERSEETNSKEENLIQSQENQNGENLKEPDIRLKSSLENQNKESSDEVDDDGSSLRAVGNVEVGDREVDEDSSESTSDETLKPALDKETQENLGEDSPDETVKEANLKREFDQSQENTEETNFGAPLREENQKKGEQMDEEKIKIQANSKESEQEQNHMNEGSSETSAEMISENQERTTEIKNDDTDLISTENKSNFEEANENEIVNSQIGKDNSDDLETGIDGHLKVSLESKEQNNLEQMSNEEGLQAENPKEDQEKQILNRVEDSEETPLKANFEADSHTKSQKFHDTPFPTAKNSEIKHDRELENNDVGDNTFQEEDVSSDINDKRDEEKEQTVLKSAHFDEEGKKGFFEDSQETPRKENLWSENLNVEDEQPEVEGTNLISQANSPDPQQERIHASLTDFLRKPNSVSKSSKTNVLKVPKSIGKIMEDLEGKEKDDITSIQNLNPDKIDHIIYKIDKAEQQNLLKGEEIDCRKECACADEIDNKSRNIGRYEIVKDFLHWMKDLQLNRVLGDD